MDTRSPLAPRRIAQVLSRHSRLILAVSLGVGLVLQPLAAFLKPALPYGVIGLLWAAMVRLDLIQAKAHMKSPLAVAVALLAMMVLLPVTLWGLGNGLDQSAILPAGMATALLVMAVAPPVTSAPAMALLLGLDGALALILLVSATFLLPLTAPLLLGHLSILPLGPLWVWDGLAGRLALTIGGATCCAVIARKGLARLSPQAQQSAASGLDFFSLGCLVVFAIAIMDGIAAVLWANPGTVALLLALAYGIALLAFVATSLIGAKLGLPRKTAATIGYGLSNRNMALLMALLPPASAANAFHSGDAASAETILSTVWLWFAMVQFPIYTLPMIVMRPLQRWL